MDVGGEGEEVHDLGDAGAGDVAEAGEVGEVADFAAREHGVELDGEGHEAGDAGKGAGDEGGRRLWRGFADALTASGPGLEADLADVGEAGGSALVHFAVFNLGPFHHFLLPPP